MRITADFNKYSPNANISMKAKKLPEFDERLIYLDPSSQTGRTTSKLTAKKIAAFAKKVFKTGVQKGSEAIEAAKVAHNKKLRAKAAKAEEIRLRDFY